MHARAAEPAAVCAPGQRRGRARPTAAAAAAGAARATVVLTREQGKNDKMMAELSRRSIQCIELPLIEHASGPDRHATAPPPLPACCRMMARHCPNVARSRCARTTGHSCPPPLPAASTTGSPSPHPRRLRCLLRPGARRASRRCGRGAGHWLLAGLAAPCCCWWQSCTARTAPCSAASGPAGAQARPCTAPRAPVREHTRACTRAPGARGGRGRRHGRRAGGRGRGARVCALQGAGQEHGRGAAARARRAAGVAHALLPAAAAPPPHCTLRCAPLRRPVQAAPPALATPCPARTTHPPTPPLRAHARRRHGPRAVPCLVQGQH